MLVCICYVVLTPRSCARMVVNVIGQSTVDCGCHKPTRIVIKIHCVGDVMIFGLFGMLEMSRGNIMDENIAGIQGQHLA